MSEIIDIQKEKLKEIGLFSYEIEKDRERSLFEQTTKLFTAISIFTVALLAFISLKDMTHVQSLIIFDFTALFLVPCFISTILILWRFKY